MRDPSSNSQGAKTGTGAGASAAPPSGTSGNGAHTGSLSNKPAPEGHAKRTSEVLGEIVWQMSQSPLHKSFFISDLEWFVMTPVILQQFRLFFDDQKPVGVVFWGMVSEEVEQRLAAGTSKLRPQDWKSGDRLWVVEVIARQPAPAKAGGGAEEMVKDLKEEIFPLNELRMLRLIDENITSARL